MTAKKETTSCGCCIFRVVEGVPQVLLVKPFADRDAWGIPKGHIDEGETQKECALRETLEEAGVRVVLRKKLSPVKCSYKTERKTVQSWLATLVPGQTPYPADSENVEVKWFSLTELPNLHVYQRPLLQEAIEKIPNLIKKDYNPFPPEILEGLETVRKYIGAETNWVIFKKELLRTLQSKDRTFFSTRDEKTKAQTLNEFETALIAYWQQLTGVTLVLKGDTYLSNGR